MQQSLIGIFRRVNPAVLYPLVWIWICGYILLGHAGRRGIWRYWRHCHGKRPLAAAHNLYQNYLTFGKVILDRFAAYAGRQISVRTEGEDVLRRLTDSGQPFIVLSSHIGNQELAGYTFRPGRPMYVLVYVGDTETVNAKREQMFERMGLHIIPVRKDGSHVLDMHNVLSEGNILSIHADRLFYDSKAMYASLLGEEAAFPEGPFRVAAAEQVPVVSLFFMRERMDTYTLYVRELSDGTLPGKNRREQASELLRRYVAANEEMLRRYPRQWFHFYEFFGRRVAGDK